MSALPAYQRFDWRLFNVLARLLGLLFALFGVLAVVSGVHYGFTPTAAEGMETLGAPPWLMNVLVGGAMIAMGIPLLRVRPHRLDQGGKAWTFTTTKSQDEARQSGSWWTGKPRANGESRTKGDGP